MKLKKQLSSISKSILNSVTTVPTPQTTNLKTQNKGKHFLSAIHLSKH